MNHRALQDICDNSRYPEFPLRVSRPEGLVEAVDRTILEVSIDEDETRRENAKERSF